MSRYNRINEKDINFKDVTSLKYEDFVVRLGELASDEKTQAVINAGKEDGKTEDEAFEYKEVNFDVKTLKPLQNEIDMDNSLLFPLSGKSDQVESMLKGESVKILGPVVVYQKDGVDYIVDGHHRWSQVYGINKDGQIQGVRLTCKSRVDPTRVLKAAQIAIAAIKKEVPSSAAPGVNLLTIDEKVLKNYVKTGEGSLKGFKGVQEPVVKRFASVKKELDSVDKIADFIWQNILSMKKTAGALWKKLDIERKFMPQTDLGAEGEAKDTETMKTVKQMTTGNVNFLPPFGQESNPSKPTKPFEKIQKESRVIKTFEKFIYKWKKGQI